MLTSHSRQTSGTTRRAARQMSGRGHVFELTDEVRRPRLSWTIPRAVAQPRHWPRLTACGSRWCC